MLAFASLFAALTACASASPVGVERRQAPATSMAVSVPTPALPSVSSSAMLSSMSSAASSSAMSSSSASASSSAASPSSSAAAGSLAYPCPSPYLLTYYEANMTYQASLQQLMPILYDWSNATYMYIVPGSAQGGNAVGATRQLASAAGAPSKSEVLSAYATNYSSNIDLQLVMNLTSGPITTPNMAMLSNYSTLLQTYRINNSSSMSGAKLQCNFCANNQTLGREAVAMSFMQSLQNIQTLLNNGTVPSTPGGSSNSSTNSTSSSSVSMPMPMSSSSMPMPSSMSVSMPSLSSISAPTVASPVSTMA